MPQSTSLIPPSLVAPSSRGVHTRFFRLSKRSVHHPHTLALVTRYLLKSGDRLTLCFQFKQKRKHKIDPCGNDLQCKRWIADRTLATAHSFNYYLCAVVRVWSKARSLRSNRVKSAATRAERRIIISINSSILDQPSSHGNVPSATLPKLTQ